MKPVITLIILSFIGCSTSKLTTTETGIQQPISFTKEITKTFSGDFLLYLPKDYNEREKVPLIIFLHGRGERGEDINLVKKHGPPKLINEGKEFPFIIVSPQCPSNQWWSAEFIYALLNEITEKYKVDENRIYLTGMSMGGFGTWDMALHYPGMFAAIAPVCGGGNSRNVCSLKDLPVWVFHGEKDPVVSVNESKKMVDALKRCGGDVQLTIYPEAGHDSWTETYDNPKLYEWFLQHSKK
jgi:predicted peptidase